MVVVIAAKGAGLGAMIDDTFAGSRQLVVVEDDGSFRAIENTFPSDDSGKALAEMIATQVRPLDALVTRDIGREALNILLKNGAAVYLADRGAVMDLADSARAGTLTLAEPGMSL